MITCRTLGPLEISVDGAGPPPELLWRKNLALLVYLARSPRRARSREHLIGLLWGDRPESAARHSLREAVRVLRRCAGEVGVLTSGEQIRLEDAVVELDVDRFEALAAAGDWRQAAELAVGEFLEGFSIPSCPQFEDWLSAERLAWRKRSVEALVRRADELARSGRPAEAAECAQRALALDGVAEAAARGAMSALALAGERGAALEVYEAFAARLAEGLGARPDGATLDLAVRIRNERAWRALPARNDAERRGAESRRTPLVGREVELSELLRRWDECRVARRATLLIVQGDGGAGKTRLADEVAARARLDGAGVSAVRSVPADQGEPWSAVFALARGGLVDAGGVAAASPEALATFASRLTEWGDRFTGARAAQPFAPGPALSDVLTAASDEQPVLLLVDDAHWMDGESLLTLGALLRDLARSPVCLMLTAAPYATRAELDELCAHVGRELAGTTVRLKPLAFEPLRELAHWALPGYTAVELDRVTRRIATDSAGLPLLAVELLHAIALGLDLRDTPAAWPEEHRTLDQTLPGELPDAVVAAIRVGFRRLSKDAQTMLAAASVLGDRLDRVTLSQVTALDPNRCTAALDELEWERWLSAEPRGYSFVARIVREVVARDMLTAGQRLRIREATAG